MGEEEEKWPGEKKHLWVENYHLHLVKTVLLGRVEDLVAVPDSLPRTILLMYVRPYVHTRVRGERTE